MGVQPPREVIDPLPRLGCLGHLLRLQANGDGRIITHAMELLA